jgi:chemotaxis protein methyltransferase CheR
MAAPLHDDEFILFAEWIAREYGLRFGPEKREILRARLEPRRAALGLETFEQLLFYVQYHPKREEERRRLLTHLTNNESYFLRERRQLDLLREEVLPALSRRARGEGRGCLRLMSAASAAGEEAYSLAMIVSQVPELEGLKVDITGVDVDVGALERARAGVYRAHALRGVEADVRKRYFRHEDGNWSLCEGIRDAARFQHGNIVDPEWSRSVVPQDVVFCRNVLIYFDDDAIRRAVDNLYRVVRKGGFLFLGHAESLSRVPTRFVPRRTQGAIYYERPGE